MLFKQHDKSSPLNFTYYVKLYPQNRIVATDSVMSVHLMYKKTHSIDSPTSPHDARITAGVDWRKQRMAYGSGSHPVSRAVSRGRVRPERPPTSPRSRSPRSRSRVRAPARGAEPPATGSETPRRGPGQCS